MVSIPLKQVEILVTSTCNLKCKHCYQHFDKNKYILPFNTIWDIIQYALLQGAVKFVFSGGEFFTYPRSLDILKRLIDVAPSSHIRVVTNATLVTDSILQNIPQGRVTFQVSIDGIKEYHDMRRGKGSYERAMNAIKLMKSHNFQVGVNITVDGVNLLSLSSLLKEIADMVDEITLTPVADAGAAHLNYETLRLDNPTLNKELPRIIKKYLNQGQNDACYFLMDFL